MQGIIWVVDASDLARMESVKDELVTLLAHKDIVKRKIPILFYANKMDVAKALSDTQVTEALELSKVTSHPWTVR